MPRPHSEIAHANGLSDQPKNIKSLLKGGARVSTDTGKADNAKAEVTDNKTKETISVPVATTEDKDAKLNTDSGEKINKTETVKPGLTKEDAVKLEKVKKPKAPPKLDNIIDCLHYKVSKTKSRL